MHWLLLILSLPTANATVRMRAWRALKASGAAVLRDGVYLLPEREECRAALEDIAADVNGSGGTAQILVVVRANDEFFKTLFDRSHEYGALLEEVRTVRAALTGTPSLETVRRSRRLRRALATIAAIDFFAGEAQRQAAAALEELEAAVNRTLSPDEPHARASPTRRLHIKDYRRRIWATRRRPWVDRLACAWLIRRFIDSRAKILWLESPARCPRGAVGFDFDGATFSHAGARVSFEVMLASFGLDSPALTRVGAVVHYLDVGGVQPPEACGVETVLAGLRHTLDDDDELLRAACGVFDALLAGFES